MSQFTLWTVAMLNSSESGNAECWEGRGLNVRLVDGSVGGSS